MNVFKPKSPLLIPAAEIHICSKEFASDNDKEKTTI